jgi:hypothetical protein
MGVGCGDGNKRPAAGNWLHSRGGIGARSAGARRWQGHLHKAARMKGVMYAWGGMCSEMASRLWVQGRWREKLTKLKIKSCLKKDVHMVQQESHNHPKEHESSVEEGLLIDNRFV